MQVTQIEVHEIALAYHDWIAYPLNHYYGPASRTIYIAHTDDGRIGLGESGSTEPQETIDQYIGSNPFDWIGDETSLGLGTAMYDLMGQAAGVPVYKLFGQKYRSFVPVGAWTVSTHPEHMAETVTRYAAEGYTWLKYHLSPFENVFDQTEAMQAVSPPGFKIHYDFTMHGTDDHMPELVEKLAEYSIAGCFEDPLPPGDIEGYIDLRKRAKRAIVLHHFPLGATYEVLMEPADIYMLGHAKIGDAMRRAGLFAAAGKPFMLQNVGGAITPRHGRTHDGRCAHGHLPLPQRLRGLAERRGRRAAGPDQRLRAGAGKTGAGADFGPERTGEAESARSACTRQVDHQIALQKRHPHVQHRRSGQLDFHGAARPQPPDAHELRRAH